MFNKEGRGFNYFVTLVTEIVVNLELAHIQKFAINTGMGEEHSRFINNC